MQQSNIGGVIDSASLYEVVKVLTLKNPEDSNQWGWTSAIEVTCAIIETSHLKMAPAPDAVSGGASGLYGQLTQGLADIVIHKRTRPEVENNAQRMVKLRCSQNTNKVKSAFQKIISDKLNYPQWLDWAIQNAWLEHSSRLKGLFNKSYISQITKILGKSDEYWMDLWQKSCDPVVLKTYIKSRPNTTDFLDTTDAYLLSAMLRGLYHEYTARGNAIQILHHPFREPMLPSLKKYPAIDYRVNETDCYFANIILAAAFKERNHDARIAMWSENVRQARLAFHEGSIDLRPKDYNDVALNTAQTAAKKVQIRVHPKWIDNVLRVSEHIGLNILTSFVLQEWPSFAVGLGMNTISRKTGGSPRSVAAISRREKHLKDLANAGPGRIQRIWRK